MSRDPTTSCSLPRNRSTFPGLSHTTLSPPRTTDRSGLDDTTKYVRGMSTRRRGTDRTEEEPMSFSRSEFLKGALAAWLWFLVIHQALLLVPTGGYGFVALYLTLPWSFGAVVIGSPFAFALGQALRRQRRSWVHIVAFGSYGLIIGVVTTGLASWLLVGSTQPGWWLFASLTAVSACPAVVLGWWHAARRARKADSVKATKAADVDAEHEDSL